MSHTELYKDGHCFIYSRGPFFQYTIWYEDALGETKGCLTLIQDYHRPERAEMQIPFKDMNVESFLLWKEKTEQFCLGHGWNLIEGYTTQKFGDVLVRSDERVKWTDEYIQVGDNKKRKLIWKLGGSTSELGEQNER